MGHRVHGSFSPSFGKSYILLAVDYMSKWIKAIATRTNDAKVVTSFLHIYIFTRYGTPCCLISDDGTNFLDRVSKLLTKYKVHHRIATAYILDLTNQLKHQREKLK